MKKNFSTHSKIGALLVLLTTTGCAEYHRRVLETTPPLGSTFTQALAEEYGKLGTLESTFMYDQGSANYYFLKGIRAKEGGCILPTFLENWDIPCPKRPELIAARGRLMGALCARGREITPCLAARSQAHFDCWVEQESEGWQEKDIATCRHEFYKTLGEMEFILMGGLQKIISPYSVIFNFNSASLTPEALQVIDTVVEAHALTPRPLLVVGRTDKVGKSKYNQDLSQNRAHTVKQELERRGIDPDLITVIATGETPGAYRDTQNRRVDIILLEQK